MQISARSSRPLLEKCPASRFSASRLAGLALLATVALGAARVPALAADFYAAPNGTTSTASGTGTISTPWSLATALAHPAAVHPGDTIWLRGGTYLGLYTSYVTGSSSAPITVRSYPGEWAKIDGVPVYGSTPILTVEGSYVWFRDFEIMSSDTDRLSTQPDVYPTDMGRGDCIRVDQSAPRPGIKIINMVLHDGRAGVACQRLDSGIEIYGNLIYYNGWDGPTKGYDHGLYPQNQTGTMKVINNVVFGQFDRGIHAYAEASYLDNLHVEGNTVFNGGILSNHDVGQNILIGGYVNVNNLTFKDNYTFFKSFGGPSSIGYGPDSSVVNAAITGNYFHSGLDPVWGVNSPLSIVGSVSGLSLSGNTFYGTPTGFSTSSYPSNTYLGGTRPTTSKVYIRPNAYETGRANVTIYNWGLSPTVAVDLSSVLAPGAAYEVRNAQNYTGAPVLTGTYSGGTVAIPMTGLSVATPVGWTAPAPTFPEFNVFIVKTVSPAPPCNYAINPASASAAATGATGSLSVTAGSGCTWTAASNASFLAVTAGANGSGNGAVSYSVAANTTTSSRTGTLTVAGKAFTVTQSAGTGTVSISPLSASVGGAGGTGAISVTATSGFAWSATSNAAFITLTSSTSGTGSGSVAWSVAASAACAPRTGTITVAGRTFTVSQAAGTAAFTLTPTSVSVGSQTGSASVSVLCGAGCSWTAVSNNSWLKITSGASGSGNGTVTYSYARLRNGSTRNGSLSVAGRTVTITQGGTGTTPPPGISIQAEAGAVVAPMAIAASSLASGGSNVTSGTTDAGSVTLTFTVPTWGQYAVWSRVLASTSNQDSLYVKVDGGAEDIYDMAEQLWSPNWQWTRLNGRNGTGTPLALNPRVFTLSAGTHTLTFRGREAGARLDRVYITRDLSFVASDATVR